MAQEQVEQVVGAPPDFAAAVRGTGGAVVTGLVGAAAVSLAPLLGAASAGDGSERGAQPLAATLAAALAVALPLLAALLLRAGRLAAAVGVLSGGGAVALALAVLDGQLFTRALDANRLELVRPVTAAELHAGPGAVAVLAGHLLLAASALVGVWAVRRSGVLDDPDALGDGTAAGDGPVLLRSGTAVLACAAAASVVLAAALFAAPLTSVDPVLLAPAVIDSPPAVVLGTVALAGVVLVALALGLVSMSVATTAGVLGGVALGTLGLLLPRVTAAALSDGVGVSAGSVVATVAAVALAGSAVALVTSARRRAARTIPAPGRGWAGSSEGSGLPGARILHLVTAGSGLLAGAGAVAAALLPLVTTTDDVAVPEVDQARVLLLAGVVLAAVCAGMVGVVAPVLRPVVGVVWVGLVLGSGGVLQAVLVATSLAGVGWGPGAVLTVLAVLAAGVCGSAAGLAGAAERDDVDTSVDVHPPRALAVLGAGAGFAVFLGLGLPLYNAPGFRAASLFGRAWGWDSWALAVVAAVLLSAVAVALRSRPTRGAGVLGGAALVMAVHLAGWPLTSGRVAGASVGPGVPPTVLALVLLGGGALFLARRPVNAPPARRKR